MHDWINSPLGNVFVTMLYSYLEVCVFKVSYGKENGI